MAGFALNTRIRAKPDDSMDTFEIATKIVEWNPAKAAVIICDMWDTHHCDHGGHFQGTDLTIEHIENYWCPTITSDQIVGGKAFRFRDDKRE